MSFGTDSFRRSHRADAQKKILNKKSFLLIRIKKTLKALLDMPLITLVWCAIVIVGILAYGVCFLWSIQKKTQINKNAFFLWGLVACFIAWCVSVWHLFPQQGMPELIDIGSGALHAGVMFIFACCVFRFINYWGALRLKALLTFLVLALLSYWAAFEARHISYTKMRFNCSAPAEKEMDYSETASHIVNVSVTVEPDFWHYYFQRQESCEVKK